MIIKVIAQVNGFCKLERLARLMTNPPLGSLPKSTYLPNSILHQNNFWTKHAVKRYFGLRIPVCIRRAILPCCHQLTWAVHKTGLDTHQTSRQAPPLPSPWEAPFLRKCCLANWWRKMAWTILITAALRVNTKTKGLKFMCTQSIFSN